VDLVIIRHGRPERDERADGAGTADPPLSDLGRRQADATAEFLSGESIDRIFASPMQRARATAAPLAARLGLEVELHDGLREADHYRTRYVPAEEMTMDDAIVQEFLGDKFAMFGPLGGFEPWRASVVATFDEIVDRNKGKRVAVYCHGMVMGTYLTALIGHGDPFVLTPDYCGIVRVRAASNGIRTIRSANETGHIRALLG
jgi:2,3-bisphosphoglycerate-dependent phosphoglycerate mutase